MSVNNKHRLTKEEFVDYYTCINYIVLGFLSIITILFIINIEYRSLYINFGRLNIYKWFGGSEPAYKIKLIILIVALIFLLRAGLIAIDLIKVKLFGFRVKTSYIIVSVYKHGEINRKYCVKYVNWSGEDGLRVGQRYKIEYLSDSFRKYIVAFNEVTVDGEEYRSEQIDKEMAKKVERDAVKKKIVDTLKRTKTVNKVKRKYNIHSKHTNTGRNSNLGMYTIKKNEINVIDDNITKREQKIATSLDERLLERIGSKE